MPRLPFGVFFFSYLILSEVQTGMTLLCMTVCFGGVLLILEPWTLFGGHAATQSGVVVLAAFSALAAGALVGIVGPMIRTLQVHVLEIVFWLGIVGVFLTSIFSLFLEDRGILDLCKWTVVEMQTHPLTTLGFVMVLGFSSFLGQLYLNLAWQLESAPTVTMVHMYSMIALHVIFQVLAEQEPLHIIPAIGVGVVLLAGIAVILSRLYRWDFF